jgi:methylated-DNA-[protein]-cysteine S-methyltransferase
MADLLDKPPAIGVTVTLSPQAIEKITLTPRSAEGFLLSFEGADSPLLKAGVERWFKSYCKRRVLPIDLPLNLDAHPAFSRQVLDRMQKIPFGKQQTYAQLAHAAGSPKAARAVGNICRGNPFPLIIPCHRVVASQGLGGFAYGLEMKEQLLDFELGLKRFNERTFLRGLSELSG